MNYKMTEAEKHFSLNSKYLIEDLNLAGVNVSLPYELEDEVSKKSDVTEVIIKHLYLDYTDMFKVTLIHVLRSSTKDIIEELIDIYNYVDSSYLLTRSAIASDIYRRLMENKRRWIAVSERIKNAINESDTSSSLFLELVAKFEPNSGAFLSSFLSSSNIIFKNEAIISIGINKAVEYEEVIKKFSNDLNSDTRRVSKKTLQKLEKAKIVLCNK